MKIAPELKLVFFAFFIPHMKLAATYSDYISIDCGIDKAYRDTESNIWFQPDSNFVKSGQNFNLTSDVNFDNPKMLNQLKTLRSFPVGDRNCYTLAPKQGKNNKYLVRAFFGYGNYDSKNTPPSFHVYLGVNKWKNIDFNLSPYFSIDVIHVAQTDDISVCLVNVGTGIPFISSLELWFLSDSTYQVSTSFPLDLLTRSTPGRPDDARFFRFEDDMYGRVWFKRKPGDSKTINTSATIDSSGIENTNNLPAKVLQIAEKSPSLNSSLEIYYDKQTPMTYEYYVYLYFLEFEQQVTNQKRIMDITINDVCILEKPLTTQYRQLRTFTHSITQADQLRILIRPNPESNLPAMINAFEVYTVLQQPDSPTYQQDVDAVLSIKRVYDIHIINWQGDPCVPTKYAWEGVTCWSDGNPRVISLNLSSRGLTGQIDASFSRFTKLRSLDLSYNDLTGEVPEFLAQLTDLKFLNLTGNQLTGLVPKSLKSLSLSLEGNPGLCLAKSCETKKYLIPLIASIAASMGILLMVILIYLTIRGIKRKKRGAPKKDGQEKSKNQVFSLSELTRITNNFKTVIGKGGFGEVYLGTLLDGREVAVKLLSQTSRQGHREFQSEANLLAVVHHKNLVSFVGYCDEGDAKALIYEYMAKGNLQQLLSDEDPNVLTWSKRLQIALDVALGLDYLHNGIKPPIVHRDLKTSNILLNESMQAKISDFGLCRSFANENDSHISTTPAGTLGYLDPEFRSSGNLKRKSDVYSFGIILLELITGQPAMKEVSLGIKRHILDWVNPILNNGDIGSIVDPRLQGQYNKSSAWKLVEIAMSCVPPIAIQRPDISEVLTELKDCLAVGITCERSKSSTRKYNHSWDLGSSNSFPLESTTGPSVR